MVKEKKIKTDLRGKKKINFMDFNPIGMYIPSYNINQLDCLPLHILNERGWEKIHTPFKDSLSLSLLIII